MGPDVCCVEDSEIMRERQCMPQSRGWVELVGLGSCWVGYMYIEDKDYILCVYFIYTSHSWRAAHALPLHPHISEMNFNSD
jgi:hypothetical protein